LGVKVGCGVHVGAGGGGGAVGAGVGLVAQPVKSDARINAKINRFTSFLLKCLD
jgi:hypothetical protein